MNSLRHRNNNLCWHLTYWTRNVMAVELVFNVFVRDVGILFFQLLNGEGLKVFEEDD